MQDYSPLIPLSLVVPALGAVFVAALGPNRGDLVRRAALATTLITLVLVAVFTIKFAADPPAPGDGRTFQPVMTTVRPILPLQKSAAIEFFVGLDGLNVWLVALTAVL